jgi:hypothetical protein
LKTGKRSAANKSGRVGWSQASTCRSGVAIGFRPGTISPTQAPAETISLSVS